MRRILLPAALLFALASTPASAQIRLKIELPLPPLPKLVLIQPGIQVVEGFDDEVFFHNGWYWCRRDHGWYRSRSPRAHFEWVELHRVPKALAKVPPGHYRRWHDGDRRHAGHDDRRLERHDREDDRRDRKEEKRERKEEKRREKGKGHKGHGHD